MPPKAGEISQSVEESNKLREKLGIQKLKEDKPQSSKGSSNDPVFAPADKKAEDAKDTDKESKRKAAAAKSKRDHEELVQGAGLGDILEKEEGKGSASDWIARTRGADGSMKGATAKKDDGKKRKEAPGGDVSVPKMKVRHDSEALKEGETMVMTLSDQRLIDKDGNLVETQDELSNVNLLDSDKAKKHEAIRSQVEYDPTKQGADILDKYDDPSVAPSGFMIGGVPTGVIEERDPEKRLQILTAMSENQTLDFGVICGLHHTELCLVHLPKATTTQDLMEAISQETAVPGDHFRLVWAGTALGAGPLPAAFRKKSDLPLKLTMVRVQPAWAVALDRVLGGLIPGADFDAICDGRVLQELGEVRDCLRQNRELALAAVQHSGSMLMHCSEELLRDKELVLAALHECGTALRFVPLPLRRDHEVVCAAVRNDGEALMHTPAELQANKEIVAEAVAQAAEALRHASPLLKQDRTFVLEAVRRRAKAFLHVAATLRNDKAFVISAVR
ncbi:SART1, partial [Symbiodinium necroappetens]